MDKKIGFLSFGNWNPGRGSQVRTGRDALVQSVELAVAAEELGLDGAYYRVHHFARQLAAPFPLLAAVAARTSRIEIGTGVIDMRYENPLYMAEEAAISDLLSDGRLQLGISRGSPETALRGAEAFGYDFGGDAEGGGGGGVVHHVWYIRTVGLDEEAINSIAVTPYRAGAGLLGAADCSVCLGEFHDGELVRLLPKCGHAFHVPCIDTWLRAHVNCPLCRSDVLDPAVTAGEETGSNPPADPDANANVQAEQRAAAASDAIPDHEEESSGQGAAASPAQEDQQEQPSSPEPPPPPQQQLFRPPPPRNVRRAASMDAAIASAAAEADPAALERLPAAAPEEEQIGARRKRCCAKASGSGHRSNLSTDRPAAGGVPRSFFSLHSRARSSVLPL